MLAGKEIIVGITGGIAAYKTAYIVSHLKQLKANVTVIMTKTAQEFVAPLTFQSLSGNQVITDLIVAPQSWEIEHVAVAQKADIVLVAPATANFIGKCAAGIADDFLTTFVLATKAPVVVCPAMNKNMYENSIVQENIGKLTKRGLVFIEPERGMLACGEEGMGRLAAEQKIMGKLIQILMPNPDFQNKTFLITAGPTVEPIDDIRFISNLSSGKMGYALAQEALNRGAKVILISGPVNLAAPKGAQVIQVKTALQMRQTVMSHFSEADIVIAAAAVGDFRSTKVEDGKIKKKGTLSLALTANPDILKELGEKKNKQLLVGFAAESEDLTKNAIAKLKEKNLDLIVANNIKDSVGKDTNQAVLIFKKGKQINLPLMTKEKLAKEILDKIKSLC